MASDRPQHKHKRVKYSNEDSEEEEYLEGLTIKERGAHEKYKGWLEEESDTEDCDYNFNESEDNAEEKNPKVTVTCSSLGIYIFQPERL